MDGDTAAQPLPEITQDPFDRMANAYQEVILQGYFLPDRNIRRDLAEAEWEKYPHAFPLYNPEQDVENTEIDDWYRPDR